VAERTDHHVAVSGGSFPCNSSQTPSLHHRKGQQPDVGRSAPLPDRLVDDGVGFLEALQRIASLRACRWCHVRIGWVEASWERFQALWISASSNEDPRREAGQGCTSDALDLRSGLPTVPFLQPPAKFPPCPCLFRVSPSNPPSPSSGFQTCALITQPVQSFLPRAPPSYL
jgi:hypothetical protein